MRHARKLSEATQGVSAVISTILMVAITVVLAATAFVLVADIGQNTTEAAPAIGMRVDTINDRLSVTSSSPNANWARLSVVVSSDTGSGIIYMGSSAAGGYQNEAAGTSGADISQQVRVTDQPAPMTPGEYLEFCRDPASTQGGVGISVIDTAAGALIADYDFPMIAVC